jgi:hypothetical protein
VREPYGFVAVVEPGEPAALPAVPVLAPAAALPAADPAGSVVSLKNTSTLSQAEVAFSHRARPSIGA